MTSIWLRLGIFAASATLTFSCSEPPELEPVEEVEQELSGTFLLEAVSSAKCVDVPGASLLDGALLHQWTCHGRANQQWRVKQLTTGIHQILSVNSNKCADVKGGSLLDGARVHQWPCGTQDNQKWKLLTVSAGIYRVQSVKSGKCLQVVGSSLLNGAQLEQRTCSSSTSQRFRLKGVSALAPTPTPDPGTGLTWRKANLTWFTSFPDPGSEECVEFNGCTWAGQFAFVSGTQTKSWVMSHNIAAVHSKDAGTYKLKTLRLKQGTKQIDVKVYDMCADSDCSGCCTANSRQTGFLIDIESFTADRFGTRSGIVDWACLDCN